MKKPAKSALRKPSKPKGFSARLKQPKPAEVEDVLTTFIQGGLLALYARAFRKSGVGLGEYTGRFEMPKPPKPLKGRHHRRSKAASLAKSARKPTPRQKAQKGPK